jgi:hypothetical protein
LRSSTRSLGVVAARVVAASVVALCPAARAWARAAEPTPPAGADAPTRAEVALEIAAGDARDSEALAQVARELLGRLELDVRTVQVGRIDVAAIAAPPAAPAGVEPPLARVWIDWQTPGRATLYLLDARRDRLLVRQVERPAGGDELAREELGHILETACEGLLAGGEIGLPRAGAVSLLLPPPRAPPVVVAAPAPPAEDLAARVEAAVLYEAGLLGPGESITHGPMASLFLRFGRRAVRWGVWSTAQLRLPVHAADGGAGLALQAGALRALLAVERPLTPRATLRGGLGGGVELVRVTPESTTPDRVLVEPPRTLAFAVGRAAIGLDVRLAARTSLVAILATDVDLTGQRYVFARAGGEQVILRPWRLRPAAALGLAFP